MLYETKKCWVFYENINQSRDGALERSVLLSPYRCLADVHSKGGAFKKIPFCHRLLYVRSFFVTHVHTALYSRGEASQDNLTFHDINLSISKYYSQHGRLVKRSLSCLARNVEGGNICIKGLLKVSYDYFPSVLSYWDTSEKVLYVCFRFLISRCENGKELPACAFSLADPMKVLQELGFFLGGGGSWREKKRKLLENKRINEQRPRKEFDNKEKKMRRKKQVLKLSRRSLFFSRWNNRLFACFDFRCYWRNQRQRA